MFLKKWAAPLAVLTLAVACQRDLVGPHPPSYQQCTPETCGGGGDGGTVFYVRVTATPPPGHSTMSNYLEGAYVVSNCGNAFANVYGQVTITCTSSSTISGTVLLRDGAILVNAYVNGNEVSTDKNFSGSGGGYILVAMPNDTTAWVYRNLHKATQPATAAFGAPAQQIKVSVGGGAGTAFCTDHIYACYKDGPNQIVMNSEDAYPIYGGADIFVMTHELGHGYEAQAIEPRFGGGCGAHGWTQDIPPACAWTEGFADWFGTRFAAGIGDQGYAAWFETSHASGRNGLTEELYVAATLQDWFDGPYTYDMSVGTDDDTIEWPLSYLKNLMRTCRTLSAGSQDFSLIAGLDMLIACAEHNVNVWQEAPAAYQGPWQRFVSYSETATEPPGWSPDKVRQTWQYDLYSLGSLP